MNSYSDVPLGWSCSTAADICTFSRGVSWKKSQELRSSADGAVPVLRIPNVQKILDLTELLYIAGLSKSQQVKARVRKGWTLLVGSNGNPRRVGNCVYVAEPGEFLFASFLLGATSADPKRVDGEFLYRLLSSKPIQNDIWQSVQGSTGLVTLAISSNTQSASWGPDDTIVFSSGASDALWRVPASGGEPEPLWAGAAAASPNTMLRWVDVLPDGRAALASVGGPFVVPSVGSTPSWIWGADVNQYPIEIAVSTSGYRSLSTSRITLA